jgi:hypothetical protein
MVSDGSSNNGCTLYNHLHIVAVTARCAIGCCRICHSRGRSRRRVVAKFAGSRELVFTSMDVLHCGLSL